MSSGKSALCSLRRAEASSKRRRLRVNTPKASTSNAMLARWKSNGASELLELLLALLAGDATASYGRAD
jgi:hypothetical protein